MKIQAHSLMTIKQTMVSAITLFSVTLNESGSPERKRTIKGRIQDLTDAIKLIDESLGTTTIGPRGAPESWKAELVTKNEEASNG